jgi:hypothetical protein
MIYFVIAPQGFGHNLFIKASILPNNNRLENAIEVMRTTQRPFEIKVTGNFKYLGSFPYIEPMNAIKRPDLFNIKEIGKQTETKNIYLYRNPWEATASAHRRFKRYDNNIWNHAHICLDALVYISTYIRTNEPDALVFDYRDICKYPNKFQEITGIELIENKIIEADQYEGDIKLIEFFKERESMYQDLIKNIVDLEHGEEKIYAYN